MAGRVWRGESNGVLSELPIARESKNMSVIQDQPSLMIQAKVARRSLGEGGLSLSTQSFGWQANLRYSR